MSRNGAIVDGMNQHKTDSGCHVSLRDSEIAFREGNAASASSAAHRGGMAEASAATAGYDGALALLEAWLRAPGTQRHVRRCEFINGRWELEVSMGGFVVESKTQETLEGAIRNVLYAAQI